MKNIAIVTGASAGMGKDFVKELLNQKNVDEIWMIARRADRLNELELLAPGKCKGISLDLRNMESFDKIKEILSLEHPRIQYLVNAAGMGRRGMVEEIDEEAHAMLLDVNVRALTCMTRICLPYMKEGSRIVQFCSGSAFLPQPKFASYAASKSYVLSFSRALRAEVRKRGITVTAVCPGPVRTEFFDAAGSEIAPAKKRFLADSEAVVKKAMKDAKKGKALSVYGTSIKLVHLAGKILPTEWVLCAMNVFMK